jgi:hypothetical protein
VVITLAIGFGNPTYVRASEPLEAEEAIPEELQRLFR